MPPPTYHPERDGLPTPLWAAISPTGPSTRIPPTADAMNDARRMESSYPDRPVPGTSGRSTTPRCLGSGRCRARDGDGGPSPGPACRLVSKADLSVRNVLALRIMILLGPSSGNQASDGAIGELIKGIPETENVMGHKWTHAGAFVMTCRRRVARGRCAEGVAELFVAAAPQQENPHRARKQRQRSVDEYPREADGIRSCCGECGTVLVEPVPD